MEIYKYCPQTFNPLNGSCTIRLGTLEDFRLSYEGESDMINDPMEQRIAQGSDERFNIYENVVVPHNCYIFCCSHYPIKLTDTERIFKVSYDSCYTIMDIRGFIDNIAALLWANLTMDDFNSDVLKESFSLKDFKEIQVVTNAREVAYGPKNFDFHTHDQKKIHEMVTFTKEKKFHEQHEYRISFTVLSPKFGIIPVKRKAKILDLRPVMKCLSEFQDPAAAFNMHDCHIHG